MGWSKPGLVKAGHGAGDGTIAKGVETQNGCNDGHLVGPEINHLQFFGNHGKLGEISGFTTGWYVNE